ncbi:MAG: sensor histidine kinase [Flavobacterium sp.]
MESSQDLDILLWVGTSVMVIFGLLLLFMVVFYQSQMYKTKTQEAERLLITAQESEQRERQRIASELHDTIQADLTALRMYFKVIEPELRTSKHAVSYEIMRDQLTLTTEQVRDLSHQLRPPFLEEEGLVAALEHFLRTTITSSGIHVEILGDLFSYPMTVHEAYQLYRIIQELTQNMMKHGQITQFKIHYSSFEKGYQIKILDNGIPFDLAFSLANKKGFGLTGLLNRLQSVGVDLQQSSLVHGNEYLIIKK